MTSHYRRGFSLVELLVAIAVIGILVTIVSVSATQARANARDKQRVTDIGSIALAMQLEMEKTGSYPNSGIHEIGLGGTYDDEVRANIGNVPVDPKASDSSYGYFYHPTYNCKAGYTSVPVVYVQSFETGFDAESDCPASIHAHVIRLP